MCVWRWDSMLRQFVWYIYIGIPTVCIIGVDGKVINEQARTIIEDDPDGEVSSIRDLF